MITPERRAFGDDELDDKLAEALGFEPDDTSFMELDEAPHVAEVLDGEYEPHVIGRVLHDFRRTAVRNPIRAGVPEQVARFED